MTDRGASDGIEDEAIGAAVAEARKVAGLTQVEVARRLGVSQSRVTRIETGARRLTFAQAIRLADVLAVEITAFVPSAWTRTVDE